MPLYTFKCPSCGASFERVTSPTHPNRTCPGCGAKADLATTLTESLVSTPTNAGRKLDKQIKAHKKSQKSTSPFSAENLKKG